jgi:hypothetical protein
MEQVLPWIAGSVTEEQSRARQARPHQSNNVASRCFMQSAIYNANA